MKAALGDFHRQPCACHMLATVVIHTLQLEQISATVLPVQKDDEEMSFVTIIQSTVTKVKACVAYLKKIGLDNQLSKILKQSNST